MSKATTVSTCRLDVEAAFERDYRKAAAVANLLGADRGHNILRDSTLPTVAEVILERLDAMDQSFHALLALHIGGAR